MSNATKSLSLGNNETVTRGVIAEPDGTFLALCYSRSKSGFKTRAGAERWLARNSKIGDSK